MKNFLSVLLLFLGINLFGQTKFANYSTSFTGETYDALVGFQDETNDYMLFVEMFSLDKYTKRGGVILDYVDHIVFLRSISDAKTKYESWSNTAKLNGIKSMEKQMDISCYVKTYFGNDEQWYFQFLAEVKFYFKIIEGQHLLVIKTGALKDYKNEFMTHDGLAIVFSSAYEIDNFLKNVSIESVKKFKSQQDLFRD